MSHSQRGKPILLTGFEPFGAHRVNSSWEAVKIVAAENAAHVHAARLPVQHRLARARLVTLLAEHRPSICLLTGLAAGDAIRIERGARRPPELHHIAGARRLEGHWPWPELAKAAARVFPRVRFSDDAGRYVCESTYWSLLAYREQWALPRDAAFVHLPPLSHRVGVLTLAEVLNGILEARLAGSGLKGAATPPLPAAHVAAAGQQSP